MKKAIKGYLLGFISAAILVSGISYAANTVRIVVDNKELIPTDAQGNRVDPIIIDGTTYLPVRAVANAFGKPVYWDGESSTVYLGEHDGDLPYPTAKLIDLKNIGDGWWDSSNLTDNYGHFHSNAIQGGGENSCTYILDGKYSKFKATIYVPEGTTDDGKGGIVITTDEKDIYKSPAITKTTRPIDIDVSVKGCNILTITRVGDYWPVINIGDGGFYQ